MIDQKTNGVDLAKFSPQAMREIRRGRKIKQDQAGAEIGVSQKSISSWELGDVKPQGVNKIRVAAWIAKNEQYTAAAKKKEKQAQQATVLHRLDALPIKFFGQRLAENKTASLYRTQGGALVIKAGLRVYYGTDFEALDAARAGSPKAFAAITDLCTEIGLQWCEVID